MIKKWSEFNESNVYGSKIQSKIDLLKDLSFDLTDLGLKVEIWNGSWRDNDFGDSRGTQTRYPRSKSIIMTIEDIDSALDKDNYYENRLYNKKEIIDFEKTLKSYGMTPRSKSGTNDMVTFYFDKQGKMTDIDDLDR